LGIQEGAVGEIYKREISWERMPYCHTWAP